MSTHPAVVFGMTLYNNARHLPEALGSLLAQTDPEFGLVMVDDASGDETERVAREWVARDPRLRYMRHAARQGMVPTWRDAFAAARREFPSAEYFAWASDHDRWHPEWVAKVQAAMDAHPRAVLAYGLTQRTDEAGQPLGKPPKEFDTTGDDDPARRVLRFVAEPVGAGDMVYGLMRVAALERAGVFRPVIQPDRLLMIELALAGEFAQVPEVLWYRRQPAQPSVVKQQTTLFAAGTAPAGLSQPAWWQHGRVLVREYVRGPKRPPSITAGAMLALVLRYQAGYLVRHHWKQTGVLHRADKTREAAHQVWKEIKHAWRHFVYEASMRLRPKHIARTTWKHTESAGRHAVYYAAVARRKTRAAGYETRMWVRGAAGRTRRAGRKGLYELLMIRHRLGGRGAQGGPR